ncbi:hypothetical protein G6F43_012545 [Rhizopus delemar]|nr:hypothetical protein G6F43_012545 [Rhizopus delemar]
MTAKNADKHAQIESMLNHSTPWDTALPLSNDRQKARYDWAKAHKDWSETYWERVVFSDETEIQKRGSNGLEYAWEEDNAPYRDHHYKKKHAYGAGEIML